MTDHPPGAPGDGSRGEAPRWVPLAGLAGLVLALLFTSWYMDTEPPHYWKDAAVDAEIPDAAAVGAGDAGP